MPGFRVGVIHTKNAALRKVLCDFNCYSSPSPIVQGATATILNDESMFYLYYCLMYISISYSVKSRLLKCYIEIDRNTFIYYY